MLTLSENALENVKSLMKHLCLLSVVYYMNEKANSISEVLCGILTQKQIFLANRAFK